MMPNSLNFPAMVNANQQVEAPLDTIVRRIVELVQPVKIILFGSAARGNAGPDSDLDLLVVMPDGIHRRRTAQHLYRQLTGIGVPFDLVVATRSDLVTHADNPGLIYKSVLKEGRTVYAA
jgi:predicted nucleotidyltransferase